MFGEAVGLELGEHVVQGIAVDFGDIDAFAEEIPVLFLHGLLDLSRRKGGRILVRIANDTRYGLNAGVYGPKEEAIAIAHRIASGNIYINASPRDTAAPFGGYKESGLGREGGIYGMLEFTQQKALFDTGD